MDGDMVIDFRLRPPYKSFLKLAIWNTQASLANPSRYGVDPAPSVMQESMDLLFKEMDEAGVTRGVVLGRQCPAPYGFIPNDEVAELVQKYPDRFVGFGSVGSMTSVREMVQEAERCIADLKLKGIQIEPGWQSPPLHCDDGIWYPVYAKCAELGVPVTITTSIYAGPDISYAVPDHIQRVARDFPNLTIIVPHGAWPWANQMVAVSFALKNVWLSPDFYGHIANMPGKEDYAHAADYFLTDRLLYGSAYPARPLKESIAEFRALNLSKDAEEKALWKNAANLLGLKL